MPMSHSLAGRIALGTGGASGLGRAAAEALDKEREKAVKDAADDLKRMTMTVIDGDFPREVVGAQNLIFGEYRMPARRGKSPSMTVIVIRLRSSAASLTAFSRS